MRFCEMDLGHESRSERKLSQSGAGMPLGWAPTNVTGGEVA